jgi:hypothetical protein
MTEQDQHPFYTIKPEFIKNIALLETAFYALLITFVLTVGGGVILMLLLALLQLSGLIPAWLPFVAILVASFVFIPPWVYQTVKNNIEDSHYKFYRDHLTFQQYQMLFFKKRGRLKYIDIQDIVERTDLLRSRYDIGNVWFLAPGSGIAAEQGFPGLKMNHIKLSDDLSNFFERILTGISDSPERAAVSLTPDTLGDQPSDATNNPTESHDKS